MDIPARKMWAVCPVAAAVAVEMWSEPAIARTALAQSKAWIEHVLCVVMTAAFPRRRIWNKTVSLRCAVACARVAARRGTPW